MLSPFINENYKKKLEKFKKIPNVTTNLEVSTSDNQSVGATILSVDSKDFIKNPELSEEIFGPSSLIVRCKNEKDLENAIEVLHGQLACAIHATENDLSSTSHIKNLLSKLSNIVGRVIFNGFPTGVEVAPAMTHGGPFPATTDSRFTAVGTESIKRWLRPITFQNVPENLLPEELRTVNKRKILRQINEDFKRD